MEFHSFDRHFLLLQQNSTLSPIIHNLVGILTLAPINK
jgi:hypothetical protein